MTTAAAEELTKRITVRNTLAPAGHYLTRPVRLIRGYERENIRPDIIAGITVAVILLPQAIAFALIADLPPEMGLYAAVIGGLAGAFGGAGAPQQIFGSRGMTTILHKITIFCGVGFFLNLFACCQKQSRLQQNQQL